MTLEDQNFEDFEKEIKSMVDTVLDDIDENIILDQHYSLINEESTVCEENTQSNKFYKGRRSSTCKEILNPQVASIFIQSPRSPRKIQTTDGKSVNPYLFNLNSYYKNEENNFSINKSLFSYNPNIFNYQDNALNYNMEQNQLFSSKTNDVEQALDSILREGKEEIDENSFFKFKGKIFMLLTNQNSSRIFQKCIKNTSYRIIYEIFTEICYHISALMNHQYGNYFCPIFFSKLRNEERLMFLRSIKNEFLEIGNNKIGTYPLQAIVEQVKGFEEKTIIKESIDKIMLDMCYDPHGVHVIEKIIQCLEEEIIFPHFLTIVSNYIMLSNNINGLCVAKKIITKSKNPIILSKIQEIIAINSLLLIQNQWGNYVIHVALDTWSFELCAPFLNNIIPSIIGLSLKKFSSNVIEKFFDKGGERVIYFFVNQAEVSGLIPELLVNNFGSFVIQKALKCSFIHSKIRLINLILNEVPKTNDRKVIAKWKAVLFSVIHENNLQSHFGLVNIDHIQRKNNQNDIMNFNNNKNLDNVFIYNNTQYGDFVNNSKFTAKLSYFNDNDLNGKFNFNDNNKNSKYKR